MIDFNNKDTDIGYCGYSHNMIGCVKLITPHIICKIIIQC